MPSEGERLFRELKSVSLRGQLDERDFETSGGELDVEKLREQLHTVKSKRQARARKFGEIAVPLGSDSEDDETVNGRAPPRPRGRGGGGGGGFPAKNKNASASRWGKSRSPSPPPKNRGNFQRRRKQMHQQQQRRRHGGDDDDEESFGDERRPARRRPAKSRYDVDDDDDSSPPRRSRRSDDDDECDLRRKKSKSKRRNRSRSRSDFDSVESRSPSPLRKKKSKKKSKSKKSKRKRKSRNNDSRGSYSSRSRSRSRSRSDSYSSESEKETDFSDCSDDSDASLSPRKSSRSRKKRLKKKRPRSAVKSKHKPSKKRKYNDSDNDNGSDSDSDRGGGYESERSVSRSRSRTLPPPKKKVVVKNSKTRRNWFDDSSEHSSEDDIQIVPKKKASKTLREVEGDDNANDGGKEESKAAQSGDASADDDEGPQKIQSVIAGGDSSDEDGGAGGGSAEGNEDGAVQEDDVHSEAESIILPSSQTPKSDRPQDDAAESKSNASSRSVSRPRSLSPSGSSHEAKSKQTKAKRRPKSASPAPRDTQVVRRGRGFQMTFKGSFGFDSAPKNSPKNSSKTSKKRSRRSRRSSSRESNSVGRRRNIELKGTLGRYRERDQEDRRIRSRMKSRHKRKRDPTPDFADVSDDAEAAPPDWSTRTAKSDRQFEGIMRYGSEELQYRLLALVNKKFRLNKSLEDLEEMASSDRGEFYSDCEIYKFLLEDDFHKGRPSDGEPQLKKERRRESHKKEDAWAAKMGANSARVRNRVSQISAVLDETFCLNYLDVGTGNGDIGVGIANHMNLDKEQVTLLDVDDHRSESSKKSAVFKKVAGDASFDFCEDEQYSLITALMTLHHVKDEHMELRVREMYRVLQQQGTIIIREHDHDIEGLSLVIDIEHMLYDLQVMSWYEAVDKYFAHFRPASEWKRMFEHIGMTFDHEIPIHAGENPTRWYYAVFRKEKADLKRARERDEDGEVVDFAATNFDDVIRLE